MGVKLGLSNCGKEHRLRFLRKLFGANRDKATGKYRILHNENLYDLYSSPNVIWVIKVYRNSEGRIKKCGDDEYTEDTCIRSIIPASIDYI